MLLQWNALNVDVTRIPIQSVSTLDWRVCLWSRWKQRPGKITRTGKPQEQAATTIFESLIILAPNKTPTLAREEALHFARRGHSSSAVTPWSEYECQNLILTYANIWSCVDVNRPSNRVLQESKNNKKGRAEPKLWRIKRRRAERWGAGETRKHHLLASHLTLPVDVVLFFTLPVQVFLGIHYSCEPRSAYCMPAYSRHGRQRKLFTTKWGVAYHGLSNICRSTVVTDSNRVIQWTARPDIKALPQCSS